MIFKGYRACALNKAGMTIDKSYAVDSDWKVTDDEGNLRRAELLIWEDEDMSNVDRMLNEQAEYLNRQKTLSLEDANAIHANEQADRFNAGKPQLSYMLDAPNAMTGLCRAFEAGAKKYSRDNWKKGLDRTELIDCLMRHLQKSQMGLVIDEETQVDHLYLLLWNAIVLAEQYGTKEGEDEVL